MAPLDPAEARRLTRLRVLLADAHRRVDDQSDLGEHLAVIALDGVGELAVGLCMHKRGLTPKQREGVPDMLRRLTEDLGVADPPGSRGFRELHRMRNMVQHEGVLPAANQLPLWLSETEKLVDFLVRMSFAIDLHDVSSAAGIRDELLRTGVEEAEGALKAGDAKGSFDRSWTTLREGRQRLRAETDRRRLSFRRRAAARGLERSLQSVEEGVMRLAEQLEFAAFTSEPAEWLWFEQRHGESRTGPPPNDVEARRALAFVVGWVLRLDSYLARQNSDRWAEWEAQQRAPQTGVPGGPHITRVKGVEPRRITRPDHGRRREVEAYEWTIQLSDIPDSGEPSFEWAIWKAADELDTRDITHVHLNATGELSVSASPGVEPADILDFIHRAIERARTLLEERASDMEEQRKAHEELVQPFRQALSEAGVPTIGVTVMYPHGEEERIEKARVRIRVDRSEMGNSSWFANGLRETFDTCLPEQAEQIDDWSPGFDDVSVPPAWPPTKVAMWIHEALALDAEQGSLAKEEGRRAEEHRAGALDRMNQLLGTEGR